MYYTNCQMFRIILKVRAKIEKKQNWKGSFLSQKNSIVKRDDSNSFLEKELLLYIKNAINVINKLKKEIELEIDACLKITDSFIFSELTLK